MVTVNILTSHLKQWLSLAEENHINECIRFKRLPKYQKIVCTMAKFGL